LIAPLAVDRSLAWSDGLWLVASLVALLGAVSATLLVRHRAPAAPTVEDHEERPPMSRSTTAAVAFFFLLYVGAEIGFGGWIFTFAEDTGLQDSAPALVTATFWGSFALGRLLAIPVNRVVRPFVIVVTSCATSVLALLVMVMADGVAWSVWLCAAVYGLSAGPQYPTMIALVDDRLSLTAKATSWIVGAAAIGAHRDRSAHRVVGFVDHAQSGARSEHDRIAVGRRRRSADQPCECTSSHRRSSPGLI
jgi:fucose permease